MRKINFIFEKQLICSGLYAVFFGFGLIFTCFLIQSNKQETIDIHENIVAYMSSDSFRGLMPFGVLFVTYGIIGIVYGIRKIYIINKLKDSSNIITCFVCEIHYIRKKYKGVYGRKIVCIDYNCHKYSSRLIFCEVEKIYPLESTITVMINRKNPKQYFVMEPEW